VRHRNNYKARFGKRFGIWNERRANDSDFINHGGSNEARWHDDARLHSFSYAGSKPFMGGVWEATQDPDTFLFGRDLNEEVAEFKAQVEKKMRESKQTAPVNNSSGSLTDELRKLSEFKQQGILSQEEFEAAKKNFWLKLLSVFHP